MNDLALKTLEPRELRLNTISLRGFYGKKLRKGSGGGSSDGFPQLPGDVTRWHFGGLTNEMMAAMDDPRIEDADHKGRFLSFKNFAWKGMSGVNGYVQNFNNFRNNATVDKVRIDEQSSNFIKVTILNTGINNAIYIPKNVYQFNKSYFIKISSEGYDEGDLSLSFYASSASTATTVKVPLNPNGITEIPAIKEDDFLAVYFNVGGKVGSITIEQLPLYPGALVFDGVDDYGTCNNFPILTKEKGYTVVALRQWIEEKNDSTALVSNCKNWNQDGAFLFEYNNLRINFLNVAISFGHVSSVDRGKSPFSYQTSKLYNGKNIKPGSFIGSNELVVGKGNKDFPTVSNAAIWEIVILDHDATEEELTKIKDYFVKTYPWLFPDQAWTVVGKTNEDEDRATIANITGNGNDLILSNFGFSENSGYGLYQQNYAIWTKVSNRATFTVTSSKIHVTSVIAEEHADFIYTTGQQLKQKIRITGLPEGVSFVIGRSGVNLKIISQDGIYDVDILDDSSANPIIGYRINRIIDSCDITIEQIPEYEGYLITDGVDDGAISKPFEIGKNFTIIGEWKFMDNIITRAGIVKSPSLFVYNENDGSKIFINSTNKASILNTKTLRAICSDGRVYSDDWSEMIANEEQSITSSKSSLLIGINGSFFAKIALKNIAIYNDQLLSKDDCIKAYNYLQTLKAK